MFAGAALAITLLVPCGAMALDVGCRGNPHLTGACYSASGEVVMSAEIGYVFGPLGRQRGSAIRAAPESERAVPSALSRAIKPHPFWELAGDFLVCPIPEQKNQFKRHEVQFVCIASARNSTPCLGRPAITPTNPNRRGLAQSRRAHGIEASDLLCSGIGLRGAGRLTPPLGRPMVGELASGLPQRHCWRLACGRASISRSRMGGQLRLMKGAKPSGPSRLSGIQLTQLL